MMLILLLLCLFGCGAKSHESYSYCAVTHVEKKEAVGHSLWIAECAGDSVVIFNRVVKEGDGVYYTPYYEGDDAVHLHGYIKKIEDIL